MVNGPGVLQPDRTAKLEPRMDPKAVGDAVAYRQAAARRQRAVHDSDGEQDAVRGAGVRRKLFRHCARTRSDAENGRRSGMPSPPRSSRV